MKNYFDWLLKSTIQLSQPIFCWVEDERPIDYSNKIINPETKPIQINSKGWTEKNNKATLRYARFQSEIMDIATVMVYPTASPEKLPVFAAEWVAIKDNIHVIVLDVSYLTENSSIKELEQLKNKWTKVFPQNKEKPEWFDEIASPQHIFSKSNISELESLKEMFIEYLEVSLDSIYSKNITQAKCGSDHKLVIDYKKHHSINSPARSIVRKENKQWLEVFLNDYHFGIT